jgi:Helix-turn-helix domain/Domain of unknown function (DUF5753)
MEAGVPIGAQPCPDPDDVPAEATVLRMLLGAQLRRLREAEGISPERAGYEIPASRSKMSRMETGRVGFKIRDVEDLLTVYGVTDGQQQSEVIALARLSSAPNWWAKYGDALRVKRQGLLTRPGPPRVWAVIDEAVLRRPYGGDTVMRPSSAASPRRRSCRT